MFLLYVMMTFENKIVLSDMLELEIILEIFLSCWMEIVPVPSDKKIFHSNSHSHLHSPLPLSPSSPGDRGQRQPSEAEGKYNSNYFHNGGQRTNSKPRQTKLCLCIDENWQLYFHYPFKATLITFVNSILWKVNRSCYLSFDLLNVIIQCLQPGIVSISASHQWRQVGGTHIVPISQSEARCQPIRIQQPDHSTSLGNITKRSMIIFCPKCKCFIEFLYDIKRNGTEKFKHVPWQLDFGQIDIWQSLILKRRPCFCVLRQRVQK